MCPTSVSSAGLGFQARLDDPPSVVSAYYDHPDRFSAAVYPLSYAVLSRELLFNPTLQYARFDDQSLTFVSSYGREQKLVPISVDAEQYMSYRLEYRRLKQRDKLFRNTIRAAQQGEGRKGLSIGVGLPKRFDQMFGEGGANLHVQGYRKITFSGRSQWDDAAKSSIHQQSKFPSLNMEQISRFDISGTIGSKITVNVQQDNQTDIPLANRLILRYKGDDDDILQVVDAGNTNLSLPNTQFVGYSSSVRGLFGFKTAAKLGNFRITAIASQEKGSSESAVVSGTGEQNAQFRRDYAFASGRIFDLGYPGEFSPYDSITNLRVFIEDNRTDDQHNINDVLMVKDPLNRSDGSNWDDSVSVRELETKEYLLLRGQNPKYCPFALAFRSQQYKAVSVTYEYDHKDEEGTLIEHIEVGSKDEGVVKLIKARRDSFISNHPTWSLMWRNCYIIQKSVKIEDIDVKIFKGDQDTEGEESNLDYQMNPASNQSEGFYLRNLGLDQYNNNRPSQKTPDNKIDPHYEVFRPDLGLLIFPSREPFNDSLVFTDQSSNETTPLRELVPEIYSSDSDAERIENSKYYLQISSKARSSTIRLGRANVIEGSERVTLDGRVLEKDVDYSVQYSFGQITLLKEEGLDPNADLKVEFQYAPFMALQKKTLLGMRAEYDWSDDLSFGSTILYKSDKAEDRKPRIGQETSRTTVIDFDLNFSLRPNFLTKAVNALPLITTEAESRLSVSAEVAQSRPNPNVEGVAYLDDFESAVDLQSLGVVRTSWTASSMPLLEEHDADGQMRDPDDYVRGTLRWHNPPPVLREEVYDAEAAIGQGSLNPLRLIFRPRGYRHVNADASGCSEEIEPAKSWGGIMRYFGGRIDEERVQLFEVRAKGGTGVLHFDFGLINEDINGDGQSNTEDLLRNNWLDDGEDVGLDNLTDSVETDECGGEFNAVTLPDPAGDNWWFNGYGHGAAYDTTRPPCPRAFYDTLGYLINSEDHYLHYEWQNGTDGNENDYAVQGVPDKEALSGISVQQTNAYFSMNIPLNTDLSNPYWVEGSTNKYGWSTYRVPIRDPGALDTVRTGSGIEVSWANVKHIRVWFEDTTPWFEGTTVIDNLPDSLAHMDSVWIADWGFVQSNWRDTLIVADPADSTDPANENREFYIASVGEDVGTFTPPPGVDPYYDKVNDLTEPQRGLALVYDSLRPGDMGLAKKILINTESYMGYKGMQMYVHGPDNIGSDNILFFFRLGRDSLNYYEYQTYLSPGWTESNYVNIEFEQMTALKGAVERNLDNPGDPIDTTAMPYRVLGRPNLNQVRFIAAGIVNESSGRASGEVWIDELRVTDVRKDVGTAARVSVSGNLADLITYSLSWEHKDPYFRSLSKSTRGGSRDNLGSGSESNSFGYNLSLNLHRFMPRSWGVRLPVSYSYYESVSTPLLGSASDVLLPEEIRQEEKNVTKTYRVTASESISRKGSNPLFSVLLNRQGISFSYSRRTNESIQNPYSLSETYSFTGHYDMGISKDMSVPLFFWTRPIPLLKTLNETRLSLYPKKWNWNGTFTRSLTVRDDFDLKRSSSFSRLFTGKMDVSYDIFSNLKTSLTINTRRDLTDPEMVNFSLKNMKLGMENTYSQSFRANYDPKLLGFLTGSLSYSSSYRDAYNYSDSTRSTDMSRSWSVSGKFLHQTLLGGGAKSRSGYGAHSRRGGVGPDDKPEGKPFYEPVLAGMRFLTGWMEPLGYSYGESYNRTMPGALIKPSWKYRLGFADEAGVPMGPTINNPSAGQSINYDLNSGFGILGGITTTIGYDRSISRDLFSEGSDRFENISTSWPVLTIRISQFTSFPLIKRPLNWFIGVFSPRTAFSRQIREDFNFDRGFTTSRNETTSRNPLLSLNFKLLRSLSLSGQYSTTEVSAEKFDLSSGAQQSETRTTKKTFAISSRYSFSAPGGISIPLFGKLKFSSTMSIDLNVKFDSDYSETSSKGGPWVLGSSKSNFSVSPVIAYTFSQQLRGGITARWQDNNDTHRHRKSHVRELQIWAELKF
ncbi:MAG: cell surface protein SprA [Candidatus Zixiibacteriota bacterium]|nr:MAG: cell surface protein SprA [candidate division Zixibacteria bacterium]